MSVRPVCAAPVGFFSLFPLELMLMPFLKVGAARKPLSGGSRASTLIAERLSFVELQPYLLRAEIAGLPARLSYGACLFPDTGVVVKITLTRFAAFPV